MLLLTPPGNGAAGRSRTCISPFRRRMPRLFGHGSGNGQRGRSCTCVPSVPSRGCCCYTTRWKTQGHPRERPGLWGHGALNLGTVLRGEIRKMADPKGLAPSTLPQTTGRSTLSYGSGEMRNSERGARNAIRDTAAIVPRSTFCIPRWNWWEVLLTLQSSLPAHLATPHLQCGSRITSQGK